METDYSIRPLCYSHVDLPQEFFGGVPLFSGKDPLTAPMVYTLLTSQDESGQEHHYLVDAGFHAEKWIHRFGFYDYQGPDETLGKLGVRPEDIEAVLLTHMHFDHANNLDAFPNANVYVQWEEYVGWCEALSLPALYTPLGEESWITSSFDRDDMRLFGGLLRDGRLKFVGHGDEVLPGVMAHLSRDGHTFGTQWFGIETSNGRYVAAGDSVMWYSNVEQMWPSGYTNGNTYKMLRTYGEIHDYLDGDIDRIIPGHDAELFNRHPSWTVGDNEVAELHVASWDTSRKAQR